MSYLIKYNNFELIDIPKAIKASPLFDGNFRNYKTLEHGIYKDTQNGFVIVSTEVEKKHKNKQAVELIKNSIISFFSKRTHRRPLIAVKEAILYANRQLYLEATQNKNLMGEKISCLVVLIREKQVFYAYTGTNNLFFKEFGDLRRITPGKSRTEEDDLSETSYINSSELNPNLKVTVCKHPFNPSSDDYLFVCSDTYAERSDDYIKSVVNKDKDMQEMAIELAKYALSENNIKTRLTFLLLKFNMKGGKYTNSGSFEHLYGNFIGKIIATIISPPVLITLTVIILILLLFFAKQLGV